jgi:hypothetical protein
MHHSGFRVLLILTLAHFRGHRRSPAAAMTCTNPD